MTLNRRTLAAALTALALLQAPLARAESDEAAVTRQLEAYRQGLLSANADTLRAVCDPDLSYSHSDARVQDRDVFVAYTTSGKSRFVALDFANPTVRVSGSSAVVRFTWTGEQVMAADGSKVGSHLHILTVWRKGPEGWKLLARSSTKL